ncbi:MAG TPA: MerR family transcriptional regulator [Propionibacteriaceae bacterium]|nr:MerR family transcriptional regulator [Propionibacteriaceae bacterium]
MSSEVTMRISELSTQTGVPVATIKFYLRESLLPEGVRTSATQAQYDESHVARLRLVRALLGPGGLSVAAAHRVIQAIEEPPASVHELLGVAARAVARPGVVTDGDPRVEELMQRCAWQIDEKDHPTYAVLEEALRALDEAGFELPEGALDVYVEHMRQIAEYEIENVPTDSPTAAVRYVVLGTVLIEPVILALRRLAQAEASARRFG